MRNKDIQACIILIALTIAVAIIILIVGKVLLDEQNFQVIAYCCSELNGSIQLSALDGEWGEDVFCYLPDGSKISEFPSCSLNSFG